MLKGMDNKILHLENKIIELRNNLEIENTFELRPTIDILNNISKIILDIRMELVNSSVVKEDTLISKYINRDMKFKLETMVSNKSERKKKSFKPE